MRCFLLFFFLLHISFLSAQNWSWLTSISGEGEMDIKSLAINKAEEVFISGTFSENFTLEGKLYESFGLNDNYLIKLEETGNIEWIQVGGSAGNDVDEGICLDTEGNIYWAGNFWVEGTFGPITFRSTKSSKSIYLIKYGSDGTVIWSKIIESSGFKSNSLPIVDRFNNIYLTGSFSDTLFVDNTTLIAEAEEAMFITKWTALGELIWAKQLGIAGINRGMEVVATEKDQLIIGGVLKGTLALGMDTIKANTPDFDVFVAALTADGEELWARKAGGVLEDVFSSLTIDDQDNIYITGQYTGRMTLNEEISIQTDGFNENAYLLKYNSEGKPLWAKSIGSTAFESATDVIYEQNQLIVSGFYDQGFTIDNRSVAGTANLQSFILKVNSVNSIASDIRTVTTDDLLLIQQLAQTNNQLFIGGTYRGIPDFEPAISSSPDRFSILAGELQAERSTAINEQTRIPTFLIQPNPAQEQISINTKESMFTIFIWSLNGQLQYQAKNEKNIFLSKLSTGVYLIELKKDNGQSFIQKLVINP